MLKQQQRAAILSATLLLYAVLGTPTPDTSGLIEYVLAFGLLAASRPPMFTRESAIQKPHWIDYFGLWFVFGISIILPYSFMQGYTVNAVIRDVIPFLFWLLPLFVFDLIRDKILSVQRLVWLIACVGLIQALRHLIALIPHWRDDTIYAGAFNLLYLPNEATVMFAGLYLLGAGLFIVIRTQHKRHWMTGILLIILSLIPFIVMTSMIQRATLGLSCFILITWLFFLWGQKPYKTLGFTCLLLTLCLTIFLPIIDGVITQLWHKTFSVGSNARIEETAAIFNLVMENITTSLIGYGWGADFTSPAVDGIRVGFTHNFVTTLLLKTGLIGLCLALVAYGSLLHVLFNQLIRRPVLIFSLCMPLFICLTLYASFKSLGFGIMILLAATMAYEQSKIK